MDGDWRDNDNMEEKRILAILQANYDFQIDGIEFLRDSGGTVYIVNSGEQKFLLKIAKKAFRDTICQSVDILSYLLENQFPVPAVIRTKSEACMLEVMEEGQERLFILYKYIEGNEPDLRLCGEKVGEMAGQFHKLLPAYQGKMEERGFPFFIGRYIEILRRKNYPGTGRYEELGTKLWERVKNCSVGVCHGDFHRGNLLETGSGDIYLLDFDTVCTAPRMFDVAVMCDMTDYFNLQEEDIRITEEVYKNFLKGYRRYQDLTELEQETFGDWVAIRHFQLQATIVEIYGLDCIDHNFIDGQLKWLENWCGRRQ